MPTVSRGIWRWLYNRGATLEDFADRLNHVWTFALLLIVACVISWKQGANKPINCWCPAEFPESMVEYTESICWNSHRITYGRDIEEAAEELNMNWSMTDFLQTPLVRTGEFQRGDLLSKMADTVTLYQWLPVILCLQAMLFKLPNLMMYLLHGFSGLSFDKISSLTEGYGNLNLHERHLLGRQTGRYMYNWCKQFENMLPWRILTFIWLLVKVLYCVNIVAQTIVLDRYLRTTDPPFDNSTSYGDVISDNIFENNATLWKQAPVLPRFIMCEFSIRHFGNIHKYTVQCQLPINEFNERAYILIWVWMVFVAIVTCLSLFVWAILTMIPILRKRYVTKSLSLSDEINTNAIPQLELNKFTDLIGEDGVMALKLIGANSSEHVVRDVICTMWRLKTGERPGYRAMMTSPEMVCVPQPEIVATAPSGQQGLQQYASDGENAIESKKMYPEIDPLFGFQLSRL